MHQFIDDLPNLLNSISPEMRVWQYILEASGTNMWQFPVAAYLLHKLDKLGSQEKLLQSKKHLTDCVHVAHNVARYLYAKQIGGEALYGDDIETEMESAAADAAKGKKYLPNIEITPAFEQKLGEPIPVQLRKGVCAIIEFAPPGRVKDFVQRVSSKWHVLKSAVVSHLVPEGWEGGSLDDREFDNWLWTPERVKAAENSIGNLVLVERGIGTLPTLRHPVLPLPTFIEKYGNSIFSEIRSWLPPTRLNWDVWGYSQYILRQRHCSLELSLFFQYPNET
jgi:hypothetical protein